MLHSSSDPVWVVGAGLAGCEAAVALAKCGVKVRLLEMKPAHFSPAHQLPGPAELVCSNSLKSDAEDNAHGLLKHELRLLGSVVLEASSFCRVPAGQALAVDRVLLSKEVEKILGRYPFIDYCPNQKVDRLPEGDVILATGPLSTETIIEQIQTLAKLEQGLYFYDALAPIIEAASIDRTIVYEASRWGKGAESDYLNCPFTKEQYQAFWSALKQAPTTPLHAFEKAEYFEGCLPVEVLAGRGEQTLAFGPMRPVGLEQNGHRPYAVVQLRAENHERSAYNLVGFQTKMTQASQRKVFRMIPGLENAVFLRYGAVHRNFYVDAPRMLTDELALQGEPRIRLAGQMVGVEGYVESAAIGLLVGMLVGRGRLGLSTPHPPEDTALGALWKHVRGKNQEVFKPFEPMNIHFGLLPSSRKPGKKNRRKEAVRRAKDSFQRWLKELG